MDLHAGHFLSSSTTIYYAEVRLNTLYHVASSDDPTANLEACVRSEGGSTRQREGKLKRALLLVQTLR